MTKVDHTEADADPDSGTTFGAVGFGGGVEGGGPYSFALLPPGPRHGTVELDPGGGFEYTYTPTIAGRVRSGLPGGPLVDSFTLRAWNTANNWIFDTSTHVNPLRTRTGSPIAGTSGGAVSALHPDGARLYVANAFVDGLTIVNLTTGAVNRIGNMPSPVDVVVSLDGTRVFVAHHNEGLISVLDAGGTVIKSLTVGARPIGIAVSPDAATVYAAGYDRGVFTAISVRDGRSEEVFRGDNPADVCLTPDGRQIFGLYMGDDGNRLAVRAVDGGPVTRLRIDTVWHFSSRAVPSPDGRRIYITNADGFANVYSLTVVDTLSLSTAVVPLDHHPGGIAVSRDNSLVVVGGSDRISLIDATSVRFLASVPLAGWRGDPAFSPDGRRIYVPGEQDVAVVDLVTV